jgi:outer membrane protein assembly factor BamB
MRKLFTTLTILWFSVSLWGQTPGEELWKFNSGGIIFSSPAVGDNGTIYVGSQDSKLNAINSDGTLKWQFTAGDFIDSSPAIGPDGTVYVGSWDNKLYAINPDTGAKIWEFETGSLIFASPAVGEDGTIYVGSSDGFFYAINPDGSIKWTLTTTDELDSSPAIGFDGAIYFGSYEGKLYARNSNGSPKWTFDVDVIEGEDSRIISSPAVDIQDNVYFGSGNNLFYSLDSDGNINWSFFTNGKIDTSPAIGPNGNVYFATREDFLYCLDDNGIEQWSILVGDVFYSSPVVDSEGNIYIAAFVGSNTSRLFAFDPDGTELWSKSFVGLIDSSPSISTDGSLYIGSYDQNLYSLFAGNSLADSDWPKFRSTLASDGNIFIDLTFDLILEGSGEVVGEDIMHPNGNIFDQVLLTGQSVKLRAKTNQITRVSFLDENEDIVQVEYFGNGNLTLNIDPATFFPPALPAKYNQNVFYVRGRPSVVIEGADAGTFFSIFTVGSINAVNQALFPEGVVYDAEADVTLVEVINSSGMGGLLLSNTFFSADTGKTGVDAEGVPVAVRLTVGDIDASNNATPHLLFGPGSFTVAAQFPGLRITGGDLMQSNGLSVIIAPSGSTTPGFDTLTSQNNFKSDNTPLPTQSIDATFINADGTQLSVAIEEVTF